MDIEEYRRSLSTDALAIGQETTMRMLRSVIAVIAGLVLISLIVEPLEFALVALVNGAVVTEAAVLMVICLFGAWKVVRWVAARLSARKSHASGA